MASSKVVSCFVIWQLRLLLPTIYDFMCIALTVLSWHLQGDRWASADHPWSRSGTWCCRGISWVHLLFRWSSSRGTTTSSKGKPPNTSSWGSGNRTSECKFEMPKSSNDIVCLIFIFSVPGSDSMGWQGSLGTNWDWKKLWKFWFCWRLHCPS